ncbi:MAG: 30S ribosomal protein S19 [Candidatus Diapherotrites archaeon]|nr:30S ribosomal protein S19 [Candidatus Diapherotrites archaeon]
MAKEFTFKGKTIQELQAMSINDFAKLIPSRARRTLERNGMDKTVLEKIGKARKSADAGKYPKPIRTHLRDQVIIPSMIGLNFAVYNGKEFSVFEIKQGMLGHCLGEFSFTRKRLTHGKAGIGATRSSTAITARG